MRPITSLIITCVLCFIFLLYGGYYKYKMQNKKDSNTAHKIESANIESKNTKSLENQR